MHPGKTPAHLPAWANNAAAKALIDAILQSPPATYVRKKGGLHRWLARTEQPASVNAAAANWLQSHLKARRVEVSSEACQFASSLVTTIVATSANAFGRRLTAKPTMSAGFGSGA
jgi:hypothetical protein